MKNWLTSLFLLLALVVGALAGTPVFSGNAPSAMDCCKKESTDCHAKSVSAAQLCCALNCANPTPTSSCSVFNFSPSAIIINDSLLKQIASLLGREKQTAKISFSFERETFTQKFQPKYIQNHSFLI